MRAIIEIGTIRRESTTIGGSGIVPLSEAILRALIAVAEQLEDPFRPICIQTLAEICAPLFLRSGFDTRELMTSSSGR